MNNFLSVFVGVPQSRYAALAIVFAMIVVSLVILVSKDTVPVGQKFGFIFLVFLVSLPGLALSLFQLTCIVTGAGFKNKRWWCSLYAWVIAAMMIFYAVLLIFGAILSMTAPEPDKYARKLTPSQFNDMMLNANTLTLKALVADNADAQPSVVKQPLPPPPSPPVQQPLPLPVQQPRQPVVQPTNNHQVRPLVQQPSNQRQVKTVPEELYRGNPMTLPNDKNEEFKVNGNSSIFAAYPGQEIAVLPYAPGAEVNGLLFPLPTQPTTDTFYAPFENDS